MEEAIKLGADGVSVHVNLGDENERDMLAQLGRVAEDAQNWGMPLIAMVYGRGPNIRNSFDPVRGGALRPVWAWSLARMW